MKFQKNKSFQWKIDLPNFCNDGCMKFVEFPYKVYQKYKFCILINVFVITVEKETLYPTVIFDRSLILITNPKKL